MPTDALPDNLLHIPFADDPLEKFSDWFIGRHQEQLPDLSRAIILITEASTASRLRHQLLRSARQYRIQALLGPRILHIKDWASQHTPADITVCDVHARELMLLEVLQRYPAIIGQANPLALAKDLLALFDQLTLQQNNLPDNLDTFTVQLQQAYGMHEATHQALDREARLVHELWFAWHQQLQADEQLDLQAAYLLGLNQGLQTLRSDESLYVFVPVELHQAELAWLQQGFQQSTINLIIYGDTGYSPYETEPIEHLFGTLGIETPLAAQGDSYQQLLNTVYASSTAPIITRAEDFANKHTQSSVASRLRILHAQGDEEEAAAVDLQIRLWLHEGKQHIGIITENRRLARRIRALLERADIHLQDASGWALSTTSAAATLERWFECIEEDFAHLPFLDLLKSPFLFPDRDQDLLKRSVFRLEQDVILHENIARGLSRYRQHLLDRQDRLDWQSDVLPCLLQTLDSFDAAARPLQALQQGKYSITHYLNKLQQSLTQLGVYASFQQDAAGSRILQMLETLSNSSHALQNRLTMDWISFRHWLANHLESFNFKPQQTGSAVILMGLAQNPLHRFDAVILAGAEWDLLPGNQSSQSSFFNERVRYSLGLTTRQQHLANRFYHYRALLSSTPTILITARKEANGEGIALSPWVENLVAFHDMAYANQLNADHLKALLQQYNTEITSDTRPDDLSPITRPATVVQPERIPSTFSPSAYQELLNCPYQFFAARCLELRPSEEVSTALSRAEYGERIHQCLEAFHKNISGLPGPFKQPLNKDSRPSAIAVMEQIADQVFARDLQDNFAHHGWLQQWKKMIPIYMDWEIERRQTWQPFKQEQWQEHPLTSAITLKGRLDRIDKQGNQLSVLDYKTGKIPKLNEIESGEYVQLPFYALLAESLTDAITTRVEYLQFRDLNQDIQNPSLEEEQLNTIKQDITNRLLAIHHDMHQGTTLPAWGDSTTCSYCEMQRICRYETWVSGTSD